MRERDSDRGKENERDGQAEVQRERQREIEREREEEDERRERMRGERGSETEEGSETRLVRNRDIQKESWHTCKGAVKWVMGNHHKSFGCIHDRPVGKLFRTCEVQKK